jgi:hypothetical protein
MTQTTERRSPDRGGARRALEVDVARTGGIAGITRRWSAQPPETEASAWLSLIDRCPWDEVGPAGAGETTEDATATSETVGEPAQHRPMPDRFVWWIRVSWAGSDPREAELFEDQVVGAWRELVDAVRDWNRERPGPERPGR